LMHRLDTTIPLLIFLNQIIRVLNEHPLLNPATLWNILIDVFNC
jgi:hypothetical protein